MIFEQSGFAQIAGQLDISGYISQLRNSLIQDKFRPLHLRYLSYDNLNNNFKLLLDKGDLKNLKAPQIEEATQELLAYFFVGISLPNETFWVNLRPDSENNIIDDYLAKTEVGKILLEADLQLKKDTAKFTSPETPEGRKYWDKLYQKAEELFGSSNITIPTLTRPWIVPDEIIIRETKDNAYIYKATQKVLLEQDYLKDSSIYNFKDERLKALNEYSSELIRQLIIPKLTKEVNTAKRYAPLRQVYYSLILAQWFKSRFYGRGGLYSWLIDRKNLTGLTSKESWSKTTYFREYQKSFKLGEYNIKEPVPGPYGQTIRSYFSGGIAYGAGFGSASGTIVDTFKKDLVSGSERKLEPSLDHRDIIGISFVGGTVENPPGIKITRIEETSLAESGSAQKVAEPTPQSELGAQSPTKKTYVKKFEDTPSQSAMVAGILTSKERVLERNGIIYGLFNPANQEITIDIEQTKAAFREIAPGLNWQDQHKVTGVVHCHEIFHQLVKLSGVELSDPEEERLADIFAKQALGLGLTAEEKQSLDDFARQIKKEEIQKQLSLSYESEEFLLNLNRLGIDILNLQAGKIREIPEGAKAMSSAGRQGGTSRGRGWGLSSFIDFFRKHRTPPSEVDVEKKPSPETIKESPVAFEYVDSSQGFQGVDLEHFVSAQNMLAEQGLSESILREVLIKLGLEPNLTGKPAYEAIYGRLVEKGIYSKEIIDLINQDTYEDPRLGIAVINQNSYPRSQGVYEAISNSLDALGFKIGQFGKGVKQIVAWLEPTGVDRIDVFTKEADKPAYQLTILKDTQGQNYIQIKKISLEEFQEAAEAVGLQNIPQGTVVKVTTKSSIPQKESQCDERRRNSQEGIVEGVHKRYPFVTSVRITTQIESQAPQTVNGFEEKLVIVPPKAPAYRPEDSLGKDIHIALSDHTITVVDNGIGMDPEVLSRMFVPKKGTKLPESLSGQAAQAELKNVKVVQDETLPHRVSFARNGEVIAPIDIPANLHDEATATGGLMLEFGLLLDVPEARDNVIIPLDLKPGEVSNFQLAVEYAINQIIQHPELSNEDKVKYINTIVVGLDGLIQGNENYAYVVKAIRANIQKALSPIIQALRNAGFVILPHQKQFDKLVIPEGKKALFVHENLFNWQGAINLKEMGAVLVPGITLGGDKRLPLVVANFKAKYLKYFSIFYRLWHNLKEEERLPVIKTDRFIAIPFKLGQRLNALSAKRIKGLTTKEKKEFASLLQRVNILTAEEVVTSYEVAPVKAHIEVTEFAPVEPGKIDSEPINRFLTQPPPISAPRVPATNQAPSDANQKYVLAENGEVVEVGTGRRVLCDVNIRRIEPLINGYYKITFRKRIRQATDVEEDEDFIFESKLINLDKPEVEILTTSTGQEIFTSPNKKFACVRLKSGWSADKREEIVQDDLVFDLETGERHYLGNNFQPPGPVEGLPKDAFFRTYSHPEFSQDSRFFTCLESVEGKQNFVTVDLNKREMFVHKLLSERGLEYAISPFANVVFLRYRAGGDMELIDLDGLIISSAEAMHTDSTGTYTVIIRESGDNLIYLHQKKKKKILSAEDFDQMKIVGVTTGWRKEKVYFQVLAERGGERKIYHFDEDGQIDRQIDRETYTIGDYYEEFMSDGALRIHSNIYPNIAANVSFRVSELDPLQRLNQKGAYKHPYFGLFIDNSDPENPAAINPRSGRRFPYTGKIIGCHYSPLQTFDDGTASESDYVVVKHDNGFCYDIVFLEYERDASTPKYPSGLYKKEGHVREIDRIPTVIITDGPPYFAVSISPHYPKQPANYIFHRILPTPGWEDPHMRMEEILPISLDKYTDVSFDGKYLVFTDPKTGDAAYLNPEDPQHPIFVSAKPSPAKAILDTKPADAPNRFVINRDAEGNPYIFDTETKKEYGVRYFTILEMESKRLSKIERLNKEIFIVYYNDGIFDFIRVEDKEVEGLPLVTVLEGCTSGYSIISRTERFIIIQDETGDQYLFDSQTDKARYEPYQTIHLSFSGRFSVHQQKDGSLVYYDHDEAEPAEKGIAESGSYSEYLVPENADVVIIKLLSGQYTLYSLSLGTLLCEGVEHIEIDSSGTFAVVKNYGMLALINLKTGEIPTTDAEAIRIASDAKYVYVSEIYSSGYKGRTYDRINNECVFETILPSQFKITPPRFWEHYDLEKKTIWDREIGDKPEALKAWQANWDDGEVSYQSNSPTNPKAATFTLLGNKAIGYHGYPDVNTGYWIDLTLSDVGWRFDQEDEERICSLEGGNILYAVTEDGAISKVFPMTKEAGAHGIAMTYGFTGETFVNQSKTFIVAGGHLFAANGQIFKLNEYELGLAPTDVNGDYFVLVNPETQEVKYLDPKAIMAQEEAQTQEPTSEEVQRALDLWKNEVLAKRRGFISQAQTVYQPFLELIPEEFKGKIEREIKEEIASLYAGQEKEVRKRFQDSLKENKPLDLVTPLPFDIFNQRMQKIMQVLPEYIKLVSLQLSQEPFAEQKAFFTSLFSQLFTLSMNANITLETVDNRLLEVLGLNWEISTAEQFVAVSIISELINGLKEAGYQRIEIVHLRKIVQFLSNFTVQDPVKNIPIIKKQLEKILKAKPEVARTYLAKLYNAFKEIGLEKLDVYLKDFAKVYELGKAREFAVFLTNEVEQVKEKSQFVPEGSEIGLPKEGMRISQIAKLEQQRPKKGKDDVVMNIDYLIQHRHNLSEPSEEAEASIKTDIKAQGESGAYAREITQNSLDATKGNKGELVVEFYRQVNKHGQEEFVEEATDNGTGALQEVALLIPKSTKAEGAQIELTGFFGTGKYAIFEGVDRLEIITKNLKRAYMFTFNVERDTSGNPIVIRITGIRQVDDSHVAQGVTVRRIKQVENTIPELDQMLSQRAWKAFTGLAQDENFKIYFLDQQGKKQPLVVEKELLTQTEFKAIRPGETQLTNLGTMRILSTKDMPLQIIDKAGLRVCEIKEKYLALIPAPLRRHIRELGIILQIPLPLIRNRSGFEQEDMYLPIIQKYIAVEFYKALAYKTLTQTHPQFVFETFPLDWETNGAYWNSINLEDKDVVSLAARINEGHYAEITENDLKNLLTEEGKLVKDKKFVRLIILLEVATGKTKPEGLYLRRLAIQREIDKDRAEAQAKLLEKVGLPLDRGKIPEVKDVPYFREKLEQARTIKTAHGQLMDLTKYLIDPKQYTPEEQELVNLAFSIAKHFGIEQVILVEARVSFAGGFINYNGKPTMALNQGLADDIGRQEGAFKDVATDTITHELAHLLEEFMHQDERELLQQGYVAHAIDFTHDAIGTFAEAMKYISAVALANHETTVDQPSTPSPTDLGAEVANIKNLDNLLRILNVLRMSEKLPEISESASDREIIEFCIKYLEGKGLIFTQADADGNIIITIKDSALTHPDKTIQRFVNAIRNYVINPEGGVKAVNFKGKDGQWRIVGFESELKDKDNVEHEKREVDLRKQGLSWIDAHNMAVEEEVETQKDLSGSKRGIVELLPFRHVDPYSIAHDTVPLLDKARREAEAQGRKFIVFLESGSFLPETEELKILQQIVRRLGLQDVTTLLTDEKYESLLRDYFEKMVITPWHKFAEKNAQRAYKQGQIPINRHPRYQPLDEYLAKHRLEVWCEKPDFNGWRWHLLTYLEQGAIHQAKAEGNLPAYLSNVRRQIQFETDSIKARDSQVLGQLEALAAPGVTIVVLRGTTHPLAGGAGRGYELRVPGESTFMNQAPANQIIMARLLGKPLPQEEDMMILQGVAYAYLWNIFSETDSSLTDRELGVLCATMARLWKMSDLERLFYLKAKEAFTFVKEWLKPNQTYLEEVLHRVYAERQVPPSEIKPVKGEKIDKETAQQYEAGRQDEVGAGVGEDAEGKSEPKVPFTTYILASGFKAMFAGKEVRVRGIYPEPREIRNYLAALQTRTSDNRPAIPKAIRVYLPITKLDVEASLLKREVVLKQKESSELPSETLTLLREAAQQGIIELVELKEIEDYRKAASSLNINEEDFINNLLQTLFLVFVSDWVGPNIYDFMRVNISNKDMMEKMGFKLGQTLKALHRKGLICGDASLSQFVVRGDAEEVLRVDLVNIYSLDEIRRENILAEYNTIYNALLRNSQIALEAFQRAYTVTEMESIPDPTRPATDHLTEEQLAPLRQKIKEAVIEGRAISIEELIQTLPETPAATAMKNALRSLSQLGRDIKDEYIERIIKDNELNDAEAVALALVIQPGQGRGEWGSESGFGEYDLAVIIYAPSIDLINALKKNGIQPTDETIGKIREAKRKEDLITIFGSEETLGNIILSLRQNMPKELPELPLKKDNSSVTLDEDLRNISSYVMPPSGEIVEGRRRFINQRQGTFNKGRVETAGLGECIFVSIVNKDTGEQFAAHIDGNTLLFENERVLRKLIGWKNKKAIIAGGIKNISKKDVKSILQFLEFIGIRTGSVTQYRLLEARIGGLKISSVPIRLEDGNFDLLITEDIRATKDEIMPMSQERLRSVTALEILSDLETAGESDPGGIDPSASPGLNLQETKALGGIDYRALPIVTQPVVGPQATVHSPQLSLEGINLDEEWQQIQNMVEAGIIPSCQRLKEYLEVSCQSQDCSQRIDKVLACIADILRLEEERVLTTESVLKEFLVLLESDKPVNELQVALSKITVLPKEPKIVGH